MTDRGEGYRGRGALRRAAGDLLIGVVTGRRTKWVVLVLGIVVVAVVAPLAGKLAPLENNSPNSFLPAGAASTQVLDYQQAHARASTIPAIVVYERPGGLTASDRTVIAKARSALAGAGLRGAAGPGPVALSSNGRAASFSVPIAAQTPQPTVAEDVKAIRAVVDRDAGEANASPPAGALRVAVGGPAGSAADAVDAFAGIDGKLLGVTVLIVAVILLVIYRSPILWLVPLISVIFAAGWSQGFAYALARGGFIVNGMTVGILTVLVFGAGTDYALLLVARLRDIAALGPACAAGILCALTAQLVFLPALLAVLGRRAFWPFIPRNGDDVPEESGLWGRFGRRLVRRRRPVWIGLSSLLGVMCLGLLAYHGGVNQQNGFRGDVGSVAAQEILAANFPAGSGAPATVLVRPAAVTAAAEAAARSTPGVTAVTRAVPLGQATTFQVTLAAPPTSGAAAHTVTALRRPRRDRGPSSGARRPPTSTSPPPPATTAT